MHKTKPDSIGYWAAERADGELFVFECNGKGTLFHGTWRPIEDREVSFNIKQWLGKVTPELFEGTKNGK